MTMVSWGQNQTHVFQSNNTPTTPGAPAPSSSQGFSFGTPAPAPAPFGTPAPATGGGGGTFFGGSGSNATTAAFGSPAPASTGLFGSPAPTSTGLFGAPAPASTGLFGAPAPSGGGLFGNTNTTSTTGLFGAPTAAPPANPFGGGPQIPAQAAFQAHQDAQARQVEAEFRENLQRLYHAYHGSAAAPSRTESAAFTTVLYNPASTEYQQYCWLVQGNTGNLAQRPIPNRPAQISANDWELASLRAPEGYQPSAAVGAAALQARLSAQQQQADKTMERIKALREFQKEIKQRQEAAAQQGLAIKKERLHKERKQRLWQIMQKVEMIRSYQQPLTPDERVSMEQIVQIHRATEKLASQSIPTTVHTGMPRLVTPNGTDPVEPETVLKVMEEQRVQLMELMNAVKKDLRDVKLITERLKNK